jgi:uncharacterized repeat protein (TIGR01451 family)
MKHLSFTNRRGLSRSNRSNSRCQRAAAFACAAAIVFNAAATNHILRQDELMVGLNGDATVQFIQITVSDGTQKAWGPGPGETVSRAMLVFFNAAGLETGRFFFPNNAPIGANTVLIATANFAAVPGAPVPDFVIPPLLSPAGGKVCFRGNPANRAAFGVNLCLSYGSIAPELTEGGGPPAPAPPVTGEPVSLARFRNFGFGGVNRNADFTLASPSPANTRGQTVVFSIPGPEIDFMPTNIDFGPRDMTLGPSAPRALVITNRGFANPLTISSVSLVATNPALFAIANDSGQTALAPGATRTINLTFDPDSPGLKTAALRVVSNDENENVSLVPIRGLGVDPNAPEIDLSLASVSFANRDVADGPSPIVLVGVRNLGNVGSLNITNIRLAGLHANQFRLSGPTNASSLPPGGNFTVSVAFDPDTAGPKSAFLRILSSDTDEGVLDVPLAGRAFDLNPCTAPNPTNSVAQNFATNAQVVAPGLVFTGTTLGATADGASTCGPQQAPDVWFRYVPADNGTATVAVVGTAIGSTVSAHSAVPGTVANQLACDTVVPRQTPDARISFAVTNGAPVFIRIAVVSSNASSFQLTLTGPPAFNFDRNENGVTDTCEFDFGDAPAPYPTTLADNGARHRLVGGSLLGPRIDSDDDGQPSPTAAGDNEDGSPNDEDGIEFAGALVAGGTGSVFVHSSRTDLLNGWLDFNADGDWSDPSEQIITNAPLQGSDQLSFSIPASAVATNRTFARFRLSSMPNLSFTGEAPDGEVEDHLVEILPPTQTPGQIGVRLNEVMAGLNGDSSAQFVELEVDGEASKAWGPQAGETAGRAMLLFYDQAGRQTGRFVFPSNAPPGGVNVLVATRAFAEQTGLTPDFIMPPEINPVAGKVAFASNPDNRRFDIHIALSYGGKDYFGPTDGAGPANAAALPIVSQTARSLQRVGNVVLGLNRNDAFQERTPSPRNTAGSTVALQAAPLAEQGRVLFTRETFRGNGRTCATCHVAGRDQFGLTPLTIAQLPEDDPLFVFEHNVNLLKLATRSQPSDLRGEISGADGSANILSGSGDTYLVIGGQDLTGPIIDETGNSGAFQSVTEGDLDGPTLSNGSERGLEAHNFLEHGRGLILENIDNFRHGEVFRASPHLLNLNLTGPFGLSGEFDNLEDFSLGAVIQHFPRSLARLDGVDFRHPTRDELLAMSAFMTGLTPGTAPTTNGFNLDRLATTEAQKRGRELFFGDQGRCSKCHSGPVLALSDGTLPGSVEGRNENFNTGVANLLRNILDAMPTEPAGLTPGESTREFNTPSLFNIRLTAPFFHDGSAETLTEAVEFYDSEEFHNSPAGDDVGSLLAANKAELTADLVAFLESLVDLPVEFTRTLDFGVHCPGTPMPGPFTVLITNLSAHTVAITNVAFNGTNAAAFAIASDTGETTLAPGATRSLQVAFVPTNFGFLRATLEFTGVDTNLLGVFSFGVALLGADIDTVVQASPVALDFGARDISAQPSPERSILIVNNGSLPLDVSGLALVGTNAGDFILTTEAEPIPPHDSRVVEISFAPRRAGVKSAALVLPVVACNTSLVEVALSGVGTTFVEKFLWAPFAGTQYVGRPFPVRLTAADPNDDVVQDFGGRVHFVVSTSDPFDAMPIAPLRSGPFVSGVWTGSVTMLQPLTFATIQAVDSQGHGGSSKAFTVLLADDLSLTVSNSPNPNPSGQVITYELTVRNTGPTGSTGVVLTNRLSPDVAFVSATASQGGVTHSGGEVVAQLGTLPGGAAATVTIRAEPIVGSTNVVNVAAVARNEPELVLTNNVATNLTAVGAFGLLVVRPAANFQAAGFSGGPFTPTNQFYSLSNAGTAPISWQARASGCAPPAGLVGWWPLEGDAADLAGANAGVLLGNPRFTNGLVGQAISFDGTDDEVRIPASRSLDVGLGDGLTLETWIQVPGLARRGPVFEWDAPVQGVQLWVSVQSPGSLFVNLVDTNDTLHFFNSPGGVLQANVWQHIALTYSKTTGLATLYVNGTNVTQQNVGVFTPKTGTDLLLGRRAGLETLLGLIDEPSVLSRELSEQEIRAIVALGGAGKCAGGRGAGCAPPEGIAGWWPLDGSTADHVGTNAGVLFGNPAFTNGLVGQALHFDGVDDEVRLPAAPALNVGLGAGFTIEAWINPAVVATERPVVEWANAAGTGTHFWIAVSSAGGGAGSLFANIFSIGGTAHHVSTPPNVVSNNAWQHVAVTYNTNTGLAALYHNGSKVREDNIGSFVPNTIGDLLIGRRAPLSFSGAIDEVSIYHRDLSAAEIQAIATARGAGKCGSGGVSSNCNLPGGLVAWWPLDGNTLDAVGTNHGGLLGNPVFTNGFVGQGMFFDGNNDAVTIPVSPELNVGTNDGYTFEVWLNVPNINRRNPVFEFDDPGIAFSGTFAFVSANTPGSIHAGIIQVGNVDRSFVSDANLVSASTWAHLAITYNRLTGVGTIYVNGVQVRQQNLGNFISRTTGTLFLGHRGVAGFQETFQGTLDEAALYNRDLSAAEVQAIFLAGSNGKCRRGSWLGLAPQGGTLAPNATTNINVFLNTNALSLAVGSYSDVVLITNTSNGRGSDERTVSLTVLNRRPTLGLLPSIQMAEDSGPRAVNLANIRAGGNEQQALAVAAFSSNPDLFASPVTVNYTSPSSNGTLFLAPLTNAHGTALVSVVVRDNAGTAGGALDAVTNTFTVTVTPVNDAPELAPVASQVVDEGALLRLPMEATDADLPDEQLTFTLVGPPLGATIDPSTGVFSWTPSEAQGPGANTITVLVLDSGSPALSAVRQFTVTVREVNAPPVLTAVADRVVHEGMLVTWSALASDPDLPPNQLTYGLAAGAPAGASVNPANGAFQWLASGVPVPSTNTIVYTVTDNGVPALIDTKSCRIVVLAAPRIVDIRRTGASVSLTWTAIAGSRYRVQFKDNLAQPDWSDLPGEVTAAAPTAGKTDVLGAQQRFYRIRAGE